MTHDLAQALREMRREIAAGSPAPSPAPTQLPLSDIYTAPVLFQPRKLHEGDPFSASHVRDLRRAIRASESGHLDPLLVWWSGARFLVVDGHHRLSAYQGEAEANRRPFRHVRVPVRVLSAALDKARCEALRVNGKNTLRLSDRDRMDTAWRLVCTTEASKRTLATAASVSARSIANMRRVLKALQEAGEDAPEALGWWEARQMAEGGEREEWSPTKEEAVVREMCAKLGEAFGKSLVQRHHLFALALARYSPSLVDFLARSPEFMDVVWEEAVEAAKEELTASGVPFVDPDEDEFAAPDQDANEDF